MNISPVSCQPSFEWGTDGLVLWLEELDSFGSLLANIEDALSQIAFAIELQTGWDHRTDNNTYHPLVGYRILLRDASGLWYAVRVGDNGQFNGFVPLEEMEYETAYNKVMWID